jgi:hypothetical protein
MSHAECRRGLPEVSKFKRAFPQAAAGDDGDGVRCAAIDLDEGDEAFTIPAFRVFDAQQLHSIKRHTQS